MASLNSSFSDNLTYIILLFLYTIQGVFVSFYVTTLPLLLVEKGIHLSDVAILHLAVIPFSLKVFFAPFLDSYYSCSFGKRKTYIVPFNYLLSVILFVLSFRIEALIDAKQLEVLTLFGLLCIFILSIEDIAADGLGAAVFKGEKSIYASMAQTVGISIGAIFSSNVLVQLNSKKFCNMYIYKEEHDEGLLKISHFIGFFAVLLFIVNVIIHKFMKESEGDEQKVSVSLKETISSMKVFFVDRSLLCFMVFLLLNKLTYSFLDSSFKLKLIQKGFPKEDISNIFTFCLIFALFLHNLLPKLVRRFSEMGLFYCFYFLRLVENIISLIIIENYSEEAYNSNIYWFFIIFVSLVTNIHQNTSHGLLGSLFNKITCSFFRGFEGTSIALMNSMGNFGKRSTDILSLSIIEKYDFIVLVVMGWILGWAFLLLMKKLLMGLEEKINGGTAKRKVD